MSELTQFIMIKNVRCSFPHLFTKPVINGEVGKCGANLLLDVNDLDHQQLVKQVANEIELVLKEKAKGARVPKDKRCLRKGSDTSRPEYDGYYVISANHKNRPVVLSGDGQGVITSEEDCGIYSGCRVNAKIALWYQDNKWGKRVNANLVAIQFAGDDEPLDGSYVPVDQAMEGFDGFSEEEGANDSFSDDDIDFG